MKSTIALIALALAAAGCATDPNTKLARADCKVAPITTASAAGVKSTRPASSIEQRRAEADLARTGYRREQLAQYGQFGNNVEEALQDCR